MDDQPDTRIAILGLKTSPTCELSVNDKGPGAIAMLIPQLFLRIDERDTLILADMCRWRRGWFISSIRSDVLISVRRFSSIFNGRSCRGNWADA